MSDESVELVTVLWTSSESTIAFASCILEGAKIPYFVKNLQTMELVSGFTSAFGRPAEIQVSSKDAERALELLRGTKG